MNERTKLALVLALFLGCFFLPAEQLGFWGPLRESLLLVRWYAREHVLLCLIPAFFIAGAISVFVRQGAVMKYLGPQAKKVVAYPVAAISGGILAVCSCTVLPLFASIYMRGAGLGPASAFLYSGPAINVLALILTARVLGFELGLARAVGAGAFSLVIGVGMHAIFHRSEAARQAAGEVALPAEEAQRALWQDGLVFFALVGILVFANWGAPVAGEGGLWALVHSARWAIAAAFALLLGVMLRACFDKDELVEWVDSSWTFAKQILPLLLGGVFAAGLLLGGPRGGEGLVPSRWVRSMVGGNSLGANVFASLAGALMYFATLTEVPILEGLLKAQMGVGPALALLLAGPALSLPNMLVINSVIGPKKTLAFVSLVVLLSMVAGLLYGKLF